MVGQDNRDLPLAQTLTPREQEMLNCLGGGMSNRQIAEQLVVSINTVKWYLRQIYNKLGVDNRKAAVARARSLGLIPAGEQQALLKHNLPVGATPFVGREGEMAALAGLIAKPQVRVITITGPGGIGKTRLALEVARRELGRRRQFPDGVFFISFSPLESAEELVATLAAALDFHFQGSGNEKEQLLKYLRQKKMLLVMDNFEHILDGRTLLVETNERASEVTLLVTSRERLQLRGEQLFPLGGLATAQTADSLEESPSAELFLNIAGRTDPDFQLQERDAEYLLHICRLVEGMPLGLELAASWAGLLPLSEIAAEIGQSLDLLASEQHDVPLRHKSMEAALDVSWRRLTAEQKRAFKELTVFRGGFTRRAALEVAGATLPLLATLANKSWLSYDRQDDRYHIHELLRQYAAVKLSADPNREQDVQTRHSAYFCDYLQKREEQWFGPRQMAIASEVRDEIDNIQRAWRWAAKKGDVALLAQGLNGLCRFYNWEGQLKEGRNACRQAVGALSQQPRQLQDGDAQRLALWSQVLAWESNFVRDVTIQKDLLARSQLLLNRAAQSGQDTRSEQGFIFLSMSDAIVDSDIEETLRFTNLGLDLFRGLDNRWGVARALAYQGIANCMRGEYDLAEELLRSSLEISDKLDDRLIIAETTEFLGITTRHQGHFEEAEALHRRSLRLFQQLGNRFRKRGSLAHLAISLIWFGKFLAAQEIAQRALELDRELGLYPYPFSYNSFIKATIHLGGYAEAKSMTHEIIDIARQRGLATLVGFELFYLGNIALIEGDPASAKSNLLESSAILADAKHVYQANPRANLCYAMRAQGDGGSAREYLLEALRSARDHHSIVPIMYCLPAAALLAVDDGNDTRAIELYSLALRFGHVRNSRWFADVACNELDKVGASLPQDEVAAAEARGRELDVWETVGELLLDLDGLN